MNRRSLWSVLPVVSIAALSAACGGPPEPARFSGDKRDPVVEPESVREAAILPPGFTRLGTVYSTCTEPPPDSEIDEAWLKDVACSDALLVGALRYKTAAVGGELLVGRRCRVSKSQRRTCEGTVARATDEHRSTRGFSPAPVGSDPAANLDPAEVEILSNTPPADPWRIAVTFVPEPHSAKPRSARRSDRVGDVPDMPASHLPIGSVVAECEGRCAREAVRDAVRATAGRVGADDVVGVACVEGSEGWLCTGRAAVYEKRPELLPE